MTVYLNDMGRVITNKKKKGVVATTIIRKERKRMIIMPFPLKKCFLLSF